MTDVMFSCEGSDKKFFAHKYVLATSSAVFCAMFYGELAEKNSVVHLSDTNEDILEEFLRFLYMDECNLTTDNAMFVMYLARKYIVPSLAEKCTEFLTANLAAENVLIVKELDLLKAVLKWSEAECSRKGIESNSKNKRAVIGNAIYQIRFASMTPQEFAENASQSGILTPEEMVLFYDNISGVERASGEWNMTERGAKEQLLLRCCRFDRYGSKTYGPNTSSQLRTWKDGLGISFSKPVKIHGVRLLGEEGKEYDVKLEVWSQITETKFRSQQDGRVPYGFDVMLPVPIKVEANVIVYLKLTMTGYRVVCYGPKLKKTVETNGTIINFFNNNTFAMYPPIDEIIYSEIGYMG